VAEVKRSCFFPGELVIRLVGSAADKVYAPCEYADWQHWF